jgi:hypothetical protein
MDLNKLTPGEKIVGGAAIVFIISTFLPWFTLKLEFFGVSESESGNGWDVGFLWGRFPAILALIMLIAIIVNRFTTTELPTLPVPWGTVHLGLGVLAALLVILKLIIGEDGGVSDAEMELFEEAGGEISRAFGIFLAALAAIALAVGGFFMFNEDKSGATGGTNTPPAPF